jgi:hypothetical protein
MTHPHVASRVKRATVAYVALTLMAPGCRSMQRVRAVDAAVPPAAYARIKPDDVVEVAMKAGRQNVFGRSTRFCLVAYDSGHAD